MIDILREAKFSVMEDQSDRNGWTYSLKFSTPHNEWFSTTLTYEFSDNLREDGKTIESPFYEVKNFDAIFTQIQAVEQEIK